MKAKPPLGLTGEWKFKVAPEHVIDFAADGMPAVLSTPKLIGLMERTARESLYPFLEANERTVGVEIDLRHLAPTPLGQEVTCTTRLIVINATQLSFHVEARDKFEVIARGIHQRAVIRVEGFARRVAKKQAATT